MDWTSIIAIIGSLGGWECIKWIINRRANKRLAEAEASNSEVGVFERQLTILQTQLEKSGQTIDFYQQQLQEKEERFAKQTDIVRDLQSQMFAEKDARHNSELELAIVRCKDLECPFRQPPNAQTPPPPNLSRDEYHIQRRLLLNPSTQQ